MNKDHSEKPKNVDYFQVPKPLWKRIKKQFPKSTKKPCQLRWLKSDAESPMLELTGEFSLSDA